MERDSYCEIRVKIEILPSGIVSTCDEMKVCVVKCDILPGLVAFLIICKSEPIKLLTYNGK